MNDELQAFPLQETADYSGQAGMTLRDYFAAKAPMPNAAEASTILGWKCRESVPMPSRQGEGGERDFQQWVDLPMFSELWKTLSNERRFEVCARSQFAYADAMLAAREMPL